jgi:hypothetical protein
MHISAASPSGRPPVDPRGTQGYLIDICSIEVPVGVGKSYLCSRSERSTSLPFIFGKQYIVYFKKQERWTHSLAEFIDKGTIFLYGSG